MSIFILGKKDPKPDHGVVIDTTSQSKTWSRGLSPFFVGPVEVCSELVAKNIENFWQFSKVYKNHLDKDGWITRKYFEWAQTGWEDEWAHRYPMGRGAKPEFSVKFKELDPQHVGGASLRQGLSVNNKVFYPQKLNYIEARKQLYIPFYSKAVKKTEAYKKLEDILYAEEQDIYLLDFDAYDHKALGMDYQQVIDNPDRKMGHAFVLGMLLEGFII